MANAGPLPGLTDTDAPLAALRDFVAALEQMSATDRRATMRWLVARYDVDSGRPAELSALTEEDCLQASEAAWVAGDPDLRRKLLRCAIALRRVG